MKLSFLPPVILSAVRNLNINLLTELRLRSGRAVMAGYGGEYGYLHPCGVSGLRTGAVICPDVASILNDAMDGCVYSFSEQLKAGFITAEGGVRIGVAGEYVSENGRIKTIARPTSLNVRIPHDVDGCSEGIFSFMRTCGCLSMLLFSRPGGGKTTMLRDLVRHISGEFGYNVLVLDVRDEIAAGYDLGDTADVVRSCDKLSAAESAIRAMKPDVIVTDELYGEGDIAAVKFARDCGIDVIASSHVCDRVRLAALPFDRYAELCGVGRGSVIYDKNFDIVCDNRPDDLYRRDALRGKEEEGGGIRRTV